MIDNQCREQVRPAITANDQALNKAGWLLYGSVQTYGKTSVISAMSGVDGMCRPMGYQDLEMVLIVFSNDCNAVINLSFWGLAAFSSPEISSILFSTFS